MHEASALSPATGDARPSGHSWQVATLVAPRASLYEPGGHVEHVACPCAGLYVPAPQGLHEAGSAAPATLEKVPMGHDAHEVDPFAAAYDPGAHGRQKSMEPLPASGEARPTGQSSQLARLVAPTALEYFPPGQDMHALSPRTGL